MSFYQGIGHILIVTLELIAGIHQHQCPTLQWRHGGQQALQTVAVNQLHLTGTFKILLQQFDIGIVQLVQQHSVLLSKVHIHYRRRSGIPGQLISGLLLVAFVEMAHRLQIGCHRLRHTRFLPELAYTFQIFPCLLGEIIFQRIATGTGMGIDINQRFIFLLQQAQRLQQDGMFEHIGIVAGMKTVTVAEHGFPND